MPSGNMDKPIITDNRDGTVSIRYDPKEEGQHELAVKFNGEHVQGSWKYQISIEKIKYVAVVRRDVVKYILRTIFLNKSIENVK